MPCAKAGKRNGEEIQTIFLLHERTLRTLTARIQYRIFVTLSMPAGKLMGSYIIFLLSGDKGLAEHDPGSGTIATASGPIFVLHSKREPHAIT